MRKISLAKSLPVIKVLPKLQSLKKEAKKSKRPINKEGLKQLDAFMDLTN